MHKRTHAIFLSALNFAFTTHESYAHDLQVDHIPSNIPVSSSFGPSRLRHSQNRNCSKRDSLHPLIVRGSIPCNGLNVTMIYDSVVDKDRYECENIGGIMFSRLMILPSTEKHLSSLYVQGVLPEIIYKWQNVLGEISRKLKFASYFI